MRTACCPLAIHTRRARRLVLLRPGGAPMSSSDGQVILYSDDLVFAPDEFFFFALPTATKLPGPPVGEAILGQGYRLIASDSSRLAKMAINMAYVESEGVGQEVTMYYYPKVCPDDKQVVDCWQRLRTPLDLEHSEVTAQVQGEGLYVLMAHQWKTRLGMLRR